MYLALNFTSFKNIIFDFFLKINFTSLLEYEDWAISGFFITFIRIAQRAFQCEKNVVKNSSLSLCEFYSEILVNVSLSAKSHFSHDIERFSSRRLKKVIHP